MIPSSFEQKGEGSFLPRYPIDTRISKNVLRTLFEITMIGMGRTVDVRILRERERKIKYRKETGGKSNDNF